MFSFPLPAVSVFLLTLTSLFSTATRAESFDPVVFQHKDWTLACDNTGTCRAGGYSGAGALNRISVLLTREAGPGTEVTAEYQILTEAVLYGAETQLPDSLQFEINGSVLGELQGNDPTVPPALTRHLLAALPGRATIRLTGDGEEWLLSDAGAAAVLLKMDEAQGRLDTPGALIRRGNRNETEVPPAMPAPLISAAAPLELTEVQKAHFTQIAVSAEEEIRQFYHQVLSNDCFSDRSTPIPIRLADVLDDQRILIYAPCWIAAYNLGQAFFTINHSTPFEPELITTDGSDYSYGVIYETHKGRGIGDCWHTRQLTWTGTKFVVSSEYNTGMCRGFPGGTWKFYRFFSQAE